VAEKGGYKTGFITSKERKYLRIIVTIFVFGFLILYLLPVLWMVKTAFTPHADVFNMEWIFIPTLNNFYDLTTRPFFRFVLNSVVISVGTAAVAIPLALLGGYYFSRFETKHKDDLFFFILTLRMAPAVAFALPFYVMFIALGLFDTYQGLILVNCIGNVPLAIWLLKGFIDGIPPAIEEAAMVDGCSRTRAFVKVTLPLIAAGLATVTLFVIMFVWNEFFFALVLSRANAQPYTVILPTLLGRIRLTWELMCAGATLTSSIVIVLTVLCRRYIVKGLSLGMI
jgi:multiple sugar transport system permease protein